MGRGRESSETESWAAVVAVGVVSEGAGIWMAGIERAGEAGAASVPDFARRHGGRMRDVRGLSFSRSWGLMGWIVWSDESSGVGCDVDGI